MAPLAAAVPRLDISKGNRFLAALPPADHALLAPHLRAISLGRGTILHDAGEPIEHAFFPHSGMVSIVTIMRDGSMVETASLGRTGVIGANAALGPGTAVGRAVVQLPGTASRLPLGQWQAAAQSSAAIRELALRYNDLLLAQVQQSVACNALHGLEQRLCRWLLQSHDCSEGNTVPLTQEFLGHMLGVRRTSVTIAARLLQGEGIICYRRGQIHIADRAALEKSACECYFTIRDQIDKLFLQP
jgi:CRP-like cAMP-binding protein